MDEYVSKLLKYKCNGKNDQVKAAIFKQEKKLNRHFGSRSKQY